MVMLSHVVPYVNGHAAPGVKPLFGNVLFPGPLGVQYFFVLSGFVMASTHHGDFGRAWAPLRFWWRRACRIYPAYWLALCIPAWYLHGAMTPGLTLQLVTLDPWHDTDYIPAAWTMRYEMAFYLMFGLCLLPYIGKPLLGLWLALTLWHGLWVDSRLVHPPFAMPFYWFLYYRETHFVTFFEYYFFAGLAAGLAYARLQIGKKTGAGVLAAGALWLCGLLPKEGWGAQYGLDPVLAIEVACAIALTMLGLAGLERAGAFRLAPAAGWLGAISYPLYVFHEPILLVVNNTLPWAQHHTLGLGLRLAAITATILGIATLVTLLFDQPVQRLLRRAGQRLEGRPRKITARGTAGSRRRSRTG